MNRIATIVTCCALAVLLSACPQKGKQSSEGGPAAVVNGVPITMWEVDEAAKSQLQKVETQIYQIRKRVLDDLIEGKLVEAGAKKQNLSVADLLVQEVDEKVADPTDEEVRALYDARKEQIKQGFKEVKDQLTAFIKRNRRAQARNDLMARLRQEADIKIGLEPPRVEIDVGDAPSIGSNGAKITMVEFSDYQCPFCGRVRPTVWRLLDEYKDNIHYVFMDFPLSFHREAQKAHEAAHCAGEQDKYFEFNRKVFGNQRNMKVADLKRYAKELQLDMKKFNACLDGERFKDQISEFMRMGMNAGVAGTPAFFINGILLSGAQPYEAFKELIDSELKR
jgi:protein-disulfide isomerase